MPVAVQHAGLCPQRCVTLRVVHAIRLIPIETVVAPVELARQLVELIAVMSQPKVDYVLIACWRGQMEMERRVDERLGWHACEVHEHHATIEALRLIDGPAHA
eukprot:CAMPEP_0174706654 /NCGR_PEP_ID=MMETSP1094-20130205/9419_1 /TAXON_ID=156173 /ORGANISM="Chrysochromulina brevifilum, Strain UTEX LB 985" /LENGTH=102 /DNA_ID=CAMNT_0015904943 /DNA_START=589 /DNA_END=897 /DNA_ORIENTATION=-